MNIVIIQGSPRTKNNCPDEVPKTKIIVDKTLEYFKDSDINFDVIDLSIDGKTIIQPCKGCISTAGGAQCHYPCSCYEKNSKDESDRLYNNDVYKRLEKCDAFLVYSPIHWYSLSTSVKALFDRLVCINQTITYKQATEFFGDEIKNSKLTKPFSKSKEFKYLIKNHWEGKYAGFFVQGDDGANDYADGKYPKSMQDYIDDFDLYEKIENNVMPFVLQLRYSGINVPKDLINVMHINEDIPYADAIVGSDTINKSIDLVNNTIKYLK